MTKKCFISTLCSIALTLAGCGKHGAAPESQTSPPNSPAPNADSAKFDACAFLKNEEIESVQGSPIKNTKNSGHSGAGVQTAQCFYTAAEFSRSVSLLVTRNDPNSPAQTVNDFWKEKFTQSERQEREHEGDREKKESLREGRRERGEEEGAPLKKIEGVGDEAYWSGNRVGGALYVFKKSKGAFIRISVGGADNEDIKIEKSKKLAQKAIERL